MPPPANVASRSMANLPGAGVGANVTALALHPADGSAVYAAVEGAGIYASDVSGYWWRA